MVNKQEFCKIVLLSVAIILMLISIADASQSLTLTKSANTLTYTNGQNITYNFILTNTGNVTLSNLSVTDITFGVPISLDTTTLVPGASTNGTYTYITTQADYNLGYVTNSAFATGSFQSNTVISNNATLTVIAQQISSIQTTPTIYWSNPADIVYGTPLSSTQLNANASVPGTFVYTPAAGTVLNPGMHILSTTFTPTDTINYTTATYNVSINVLNTTRKTPTIYWSNPTDIVYGTPLSSTQLNAIVPMSSSPWFLPGIFDYNPAAGTVLNIGSNQILSTTFTPTDTINYTTATYNVSINVTQATPTIYWSNPTDIVYGTPLSSTQLNANASVPGTFVYTPAAGTVLNIGSHQILSTAFTPTDTVNYTTTSANVSVNVVYPIGLSNLASSSIYPGNSMTYLLSYYNAINMSNVVLTDKLPNNVDFVSATDGGVYDFSNGTVTWNLGILNSSAGGSGQGPGGRRGHRGGWSSNTTNLTVSIPQNTPIGTVIINTANISSLGLDSGLFYTSGDISTNTVVNQNPLPTNVTVEPQNGGVGTTSVYWGNPTTFSYQSCDNATGVDISIHVDDSLPDISGSMAGGPPNWNYTTTFYPRHGAANVNYTVYGCADVQTIMFNIYIDPAGYIYDINTGKRITGASVWLQRPDGAAWENVPTGEGTAIPDQNPEVTNANGQYQWDVLPGIYRVHVENAGYESADSTVVTVPPPVEDLNVGLTTATPPIVKTPIIYWNTPADITYGTPLSSTQLDATATDPVSGVIVNGTFVYTPPAGTALSAGMHTLTATFTSTDSNYASGGMVTATINVNKATPTLSWTPNPTTITYGTALVAGQLNAQSSASGTFAYTEGSTPVGTSTVLSAGTHTLTATFTPIDTTNYTAAAYSVSINVLTPVQKIQQMITLIQDLVNSGKLNHGQANSLIVKLNTAKMNINHENTHAATNELNAFINEVNADIKTGKLSSTYGQTLIDEANAVISAIK